MKMAADAVAAARTALILDEPFWGALALRLEIVEDPTCPTAWTDGVRLGYNPEFVLSLTLAQLKGLIAHEVMHCAMGHPWRRSGRDPFQWNVACDFAVNPVLVDAKFKLPDGALLDAAYHGRAAEWVYDRLPPPPSPPPAEGGQGEPQGGDEGGGGANPTPGAPPEVQGGAAAPGVPPAAPPPAPVQAAPPPAPGAQGAQGASGGAAAPGPAPYTALPAGTAQGAPGDPQAPTAPGPGAPAPSAPPPPTGPGGPGWGEVRDAPADAKAQDGGDASEAGWQQAVQQAAAMAKARGSLPAGLARFAKEAAKSRVDWRSVLRRFVTEVARADYSWTRPNPRYLPGGLYLPALRNEQMGPMLVAVDTSGSIDDVTLAQFAGEINAIVEDVRPEMVHVMFCDAAVKKTQEFYPGDPIELKPVGGGGTDFRPVFRKAEKLDAPPVCAVYLTDMMGSFPEAEPEYPVLWASTWGDDAPFGEVVKLS